MKNRIPALSLCLFAASCVAPTASLRPRFGTLEISGSIVANDDDASASTTTEALGLDEDDSVFNPRVDLGWLGSRLSLATFDTHFEGDGTTQAEINFGGMSISEMVDVHTEMDLAVHSGTFIWDFAPGDALELGLGVGVTVIDLDATVMETGGGGATTSTSSRAC